MEQQQCTLAAHISVRYFFERQKYEEGRLDVQYVKTTDQLADLFTKQLPQAQHEKLTLSLMGYNLPIANKDGSSTTLQ